jgi:hypothetical protein
LIIYAGFGFATAGSEGVVVTVFFLLLKALFSAILGIAACFGAALLLNTHFGTLKSASANLAAATLFPGAAGLLIAMISPLLGAIAVIVLAAGLLKSLFDLEFFELIVFVLMLWGVSWVAEQAIAWIQ